MIREVLIAPLIGLQAALSVLLALGVYRYWPDADAAWFRFITPLALACLGVRLGFPTLFAVIKYHVQTRRKRLAHEAKHGKGDGSFETRENLKAAGCFDPNKGIPVGMFEGEPIFAQFTHAAAIAPAGTGKSISIANPALCHGYRIPGKREGESTAASAIVSDLKPELEPMTARLRQEVHGQRVIKLAPSDPLTASYNPLDLVIDCLHGSLPRARALTLADFLAHTIEPEPPNDSKDKFWRAGGRNLIIMAILWLCLERPDQATLAEVCRIIRDPAALEEMIAACATSDALGGELGIMARDVLEQGKYFNEFRTGAALALKPFSAAGELANVTGPSTFRWRDLKHEPSTVYICANLAESRVFAPWLKLIAECATTELEFSKGNIPVQFCLDEATNFSGFDVASKMTALRSAGVRLHLIFQERSELERAFGQHAKDTILGEVDLEQYFNFQDTKLAQEIEKRLGTVEVVKPSYQTGENPWDTYRESSGTARKPLMSAYQLMYEMPPTDQIIFIKSRKKALRPVYCQKLSYDFVAEWIAMLDDNPIEGGKLRGPPSIRMKYTKNSVCVTKFKRTAPLVTWAQVKHFARFLPPLWAAWAGVWVWAALAAFHHVVSYLPNQVIS